VVQLYEDTKEKFKDRIARETERLAAAERERRIKEYLDTIGVYETSSFAVTFLPFGLSQRQNKQYRKGYLFMAGQAVTLVPSVAIFVYLAGKYGLSSTQVPLQDGPRVRQLQQIEIGTGLAFIGLYAWGVADAIINFKSKRLIKGDDSLLPKDFLDGTQLPKAPPKKTSLRDRLRIGPMITPTGVGIGLGWEND
jgi:nucleoid DNA-binding protein